MKAVILAGGYGTRLGEIGKNTAKSLIKVAGVPILEHILRKIAEVPEIHEVIIVTNDRFYQDFQQWNNSYTYPKNIKILNDGTTSNEDRLGAVGDFNFAIQQENITDDVLLIAGDNLFEFSLRHFIDMFNENRKSTVAFIDFQDVEQVRSKFGVALIEGTTVIDFEEKPANPKSALASTMCYVFNKDDLALTKQLIAQGSADNGGDIIKGLVETSEVQAFVFTEPWFDIGSVESLTAAEELYSIKNHSS